MNLEQRNAVMAREDRLRAWMKEHETNSYKAEEVAHLNPPTNEERGSVELFDLLNDKPQRYLLYINEGKRLATTWMGDKLGDVQFGQTWHDNFGGQRQSVRINAINGWIYSGTYFKSAGDYARVKAIK